MAESTKIIGDLEDTIDSILDKYAKDYPKTYNSVFSDLEDFVRLLKRDSRGNIKASVENLRAINKYMPKLRNDMLNGDYGKTTNAYIKDFEKVSNLSNSYFTALVGSDFSAKEALYKEILVQNIETTIETLKGSGLTENVLNPIRQILTNNVSGGGTLKDTILALRTELLDKGQPINWIKQQATDSLNQYNRNYIQTISLDLGLEFYLYQGTKIATSRPFCVARHGRYFEKETVESWGNLGEWSGKIDGTNSTTIFSYCGGYNCRHSLIPVSKSVYDNAVKNGKAGLR